MRIGQAFPSKYLKAADLGNRTIRVKMSRVQLEDLGDEEKPILYFVGKQKGLVLNKTNSERIALVFGDETDAWQNEEIELYPDKTSFQGKLVDCVRVRPIAPPPEDGNPGPDDEIPF